jgi:hypothetical protein
VIGLGLLLAVVFIGGILYFPDAPIYRKGGAFVGKYGQVHPESHFLAYRYWTYGVIAVFLAMFAACIASMAWTGREDAPQQT